jgi:hypothetical protein
MLRIAEDEGRFRAGANYKFKTDDPRRDGDERNRTVGVIARADFALPLTKVEYVCTFGSVDRDLSQGLVLVPRREELDFTRCRWNV